ncbi:MAG: NADH-quinone oxidoreductase subunit N [Acidobacteriota bacterium]|nr:NADH-quinone oxidoreductase subunit N [Acidobacteriota bacterium]
MTASDILALLPLLLVAATSVVVMLAAAMHRSHALAFGLTLAGLASAFCSIFFGHPRQVTALLIIDSYALFFMGLIVAASFAVALLAYGYLARREGNREEFYVLILVATLGAMVLTASTHFASFFLGLEILSVALYSLISYLHGRALPVEAGIKYLVLAAASAAFLLFGMALIYADLGTMEFARMAQLLASKVAVDPTLLLPGVALIVTGIGFKLALVPFHMWTPDVYEGAPAPVTAFVATVSKGGMFALLLRYFHQSGAHNFAPVFLVFSIIAVASMLAGNLLALLQNNVKRILAYSSIAHLGYLLVAFQIGGPLGGGAAAFYLVAYFVMTLGAFGVVTVLSERQRDADLLEDYRGLFWRRPTLALVFTAMLLSLAGIPLTVGFLGKFYIITAGASVGAWALILILVITSTIGLFYYLRIVVTLYQQPATSDRAHEPTPRKAPAATLALAALTVILVWLGIYPIALLRVIQNAIGSLG